MRRRRGTGDAEETFWPGVVDLFAFGMAVLLIVALSAFREASLSPYDRLRIRAEALADSIRQELGMPPSAITDAQRENGARKDTIQILSFDGRRLEFDSGSAHLAPEDTTLLHSYFSTKLARAVGARAAAEIYVEGTADWQPLSSTVHPQNNIELSALRAATVAKVLRNASPPLTEKLRVVGLGEVGEKPNAASPDSAVKRTLRRYRRVSIGVRIDWEVLAKEMNGGR